MTKGQGGGRTSAKIWDDENRKELYKESEAAMEAVDWDEDDAEGDF